MKEGIVRPSSFYWAFCLLNTGIFLNIYYSSKNYIFFAFSILFFIIGLIIGNNKKIKNKLNYEER